MFQDDIPRDIWNYGAFYLSLTLVMLGCSPEQASQGLPATGASTTAPLPLPALPQRAHSGAACARRDTWGFTQTV